MPTVRSLRRSRGLTFAELALASGIPARTLVQIEYGYCTLNQDMRQRLAQIFNLSPQSLLATPSSTQNYHRPFRTPQLLTPLAAASVIGTLLWGTSLGLRDLSAANVSPMSVSVSALSTTAVPVAQPTATQAFSSTAAGVMARQMEIPTATPPASLPDLDVPPMMIPTPASLPPISAEVPFSPDALRSLPPALPLPPVPAQAAFPLVPSDQFVLRNEGPYGCPLAAAPERVIVTQGYGVGTHAPGPIWGGIDLVLDNGATFGAPIVATHQGVATVFPDSWPGGNFILIENHATGWTTAYGHLDLIMVSSGQEVEAGTQIGTLGNTGWTTGPHLHYEVRQPGYGNIDPAPLIECQ